MTDSLATIVDGAVMDSSVPTAAGAVHRIRIEAWPAPAEERLVRIELIGRGGRVLASVPRFVGGVLELALDGEDHAGWVLARACQVPVADFRIDAMRQAIAGASHTV